jgi:hypothetical protein
MNRQSQGYLLRRGGSPLLRLGLRHVMSDGPADHRAACDMPLRQRRLGADRERGGDNCGDDLLGQGTLPAKPFMRRFTSLTRQVTLVVASAPPLFG